MVKRSVAALTKALSRVVDYKYAMKKRFDNRGNPKK
jgi:hypothetical protein